MMIQKIDGFVNKDSFEKFITTVSGEQDRIILKRRSNFETYKAHTLRLTVHIDGQVVHDDP